MSDIAKAMYQVTQTLLRTDIAGESGWLSDIHHGVLTEGASTDGASTEGASTDGASTEGVSGAGDWSGVSASSDMVVF
jgi:hypothetical protein